MLKDSSYGIIPLMYHDDTQYTIMIHLSSGNHRWIPKWHGEPWETPLESALRELYEETGLQITAEQVDTASIYTEQYICYSARHGHDVDKTVMYYTAQLPYTDVTQLFGYSEWDGEIVDKKILPLTEAIALATYEQTAHILREVEQSLR